MKCWRCGKGNDENEEFCIHCSAQLFKSLDTFMIMRRPLKVYYFSYGYTRDPTQMTKEVQALVLEILKVRQDIVPLVPHFVVDALFDFPKGYSIPESTNWEVEIISRCDGVIYDPKMLETSTGVKWEVAIAQKLGVKVYTYDQIRHGDDLK